MNALELSEALGAVPQEMIDTALDEQTSGGAAHSSPFLSRIMTIIAAAACLVLAVGSVSLIAVLRNRRDNPQNPVYTTAENTAAVSDPDQTTASEADPVQTGETVISVTGRVVSTDESGNALSGQSWPLRTTAAGERRETTADTADDNLEETTIDPNDHGSKPTGTKSTDAQTTETQTTEPMSRELPYRCRYQFCQWTSDWRDEFDEITMQGKWYTLGLNKLIRSYDEFKGIGLNTDYMDYTPEFFQNHSLIFCFAEFSEIGSRPEITSVTLQKRDAASGMYDITVTAARTAGTEAAMQRWLCFLEADNSDLGGLKDREWYYAAVQVDILNRQAADDSFLWSAKSGSYYEWFDHIHEPGGAYAHSELKASDSLFFRCEEGLITVIRDGKTVFWVGGNPLVSAYFTDLNGDGMNELCVTWGFGSGMYSQGITVYDIKNNTVYTLDERGDYDYTMTEENGKLIVKRTEFEQHSFLSEDAFYAAGTLRIQNGCLIFTQVSGMPDAAAVRDEICGELAALPYSERVNSYYSDGPQYRLLDGNGLSYLFINWEYVRRTDSGLSAKLPQELSEKIQANGREIGLQQYGVDFGLE